MEIEKIRENILNNVPFELNLSDISFKGIQNDGYNVISPDGFRPSVPDYGGGELSVQTDNAPGYPTASNFSDVFLTDLIMSAPILDNSRFIKMNTLQERIPTLDGDIHFENIREKGISGTFTKSYHQGDDEEANYTLDDLWLNARELVAFYSVHETFLRENLEGQAFMNHISNFLTAKSAPELESVFLYSKRPDTGPLANNYAAGIPSSYKYNSGVIERIKANEMNWDNGIWGVPADNVIKTSDPLTSFVKYIKWASSVKQDKWKNKPGILPNQLVCYLPPTLLMDLQYAISQRLTALGDNYISGAKFGGYDRLYQVPLIPVDSLEIPKQVINYTGGSPEAIAANADQLAKKVILTVPNNIIYGIYDQIKTRWQFDLRDLSYVSALQLSVDQQVLWGRLTSYAKIAEDGGPLGTLAIEEGGFEP